MSYTGDTDWSRPQLGSQQQADAAQELEALRAGYYPADSRSQASWSGFADAMFGGPNRIDERPQVYEPNAGSFNLGMAGSSAEGWQRGLAGQAGAAYGEANRADQRFGQLYGQSGQDYTRATGAYNQGQAALNMYQQAAQGNAPSVAAIQQQQGLEQAMANQRAMAASGPYNPAAGLVAAQNAAQMQGQSVNQQALLRAQETATGRAQYGQMLGQQQQGALGLSGMTTAQQQLAQQQGQNQRNYNLGLLGEVRQVGAQQQQGQIAYEQERGQQQIAAMQVNQARLEANQAAKNKKDEGITSGVGAGIGAIAAMSDESSKQELATARDEIQNLRQQLSTMSVNAGKHAATGEGGMGGGIMSGMALGQLMSDERAKRSAYERGSEDAMRRMLSGAAAPADELAHVPPRSYEYRPEVRAAYPEMTAPGRRYGVVAQDLERAGPVGRSLVREGPGGYKAIDVPQATGALLAAVGQQQRELDALQASGPAVRREELVPEGWDDFVRRSLAERAGR